MECKLIVLILVCNNKQLMITTYGRPIPEQFCQHSISDFAQKTFQIRSFKQEEITKDLAYLSSRRHPLLSLSTLQLITRRILIHLWPSLLRLPVLLLLLALLVWTLLFIKLKLKQNHDFTREQIELAWWQVRA